MQELFANNAITTLASNLGSGATSLSLHAGGGALFPNPTPGSQFFRLSLTSATTAATEIVICTARTADVCTVIRAQEGTTALAFSTGDTVANQVTAGMMVNTYSPSADQQNVVRYALETGSGNAFQVALNPALPAGVLGAEVMFKASHANTAAATLQINSGTIYPLISLIGTSLSGGEISNNSMVRAVWNGTGYSIIYSTDSPPLVFSSTAEAQAGTATNKAINPSLFGLALQGANRTSTIQRFPGAVGSRLTIAIARGPIKDATIDGNTNYTVAYPLTFTSLFIASVSTKQVSTGANFANASCALQGDPGLSNCSVIYDYFGGGTSGSTIQAEVLLVGLS